MNERPLTVRERRILRETEQLLREDPQLTALFESFPAPPERPRRLWRWPLYYLCLVLGTVLMVVSVSLGILVLTTLAVTMVWRAVTHRRAPKRDP